MTTGSSVGEQLAVTPNWRIGVWSFVGAAAAIGGVCIALALSWAPIAAGGDVIVPLIGFEAAICAALTAFAVRALWRARSVSKPERLRKRLAGVLAAVALFPATVTATFAALTLHFGLEAWFGERVHAVVENATGAASSYMRAHAAAIRDDARTAASALAAAQADGARSEPRALEEMLTALARERGLTGLILLNAGGEPRAFAQTSDRTWMLPPPSSFEEARAGATVLGANAEAGIVRALQRVEGEADAYLLAQRSVHPDVIAQLQKADEAAAAYRAVLDNREALQGAFALSYAILALTALAGSAWLGLTAADRLAKPVGHMIDAARAVREGDLNARVPEWPGDNDLGDLCRAFNAMTARLETQRTDLIAANDDLARRNAFIETVLNGVGAGIVALDKCGRVTLANPTAEDVLGADASTCPSLQDAWPALADLAASAGADGEIRGVLERVIDGESRRYAVRVALRADGAVVTFDDVTAQAAAERAAIWSEAARRVAHEIRNPLTPMRLAAQRIRRRAAADTDLKRASESLLRQVDTVQGLVNAFASQARLPNHEPIRTDLAAIALECAEDWREFEDGLRVKVESDGPVQVIGDAEALRRALGNLLRNAVQSVMARRREDSKIATIHVSATVRNGQAVIEIVDDGLGLERAGPASTPCRDGAAWEREGLGLAIVAKICADHGGRFTLQQRTDAQGAVARITLPHSRAGAVASYEGEAAWPMS